jgi:replication factor A1
MQAHVHPKERRLVEGKVYELSGFVVHASEGKYMTCRNPFVMNIGSRTVVNEIAGDVDSIPLHHFEFVDFHDVHSRNCNNSLLTGKCLEI